MTAVAEPISVFQQLADLRPACVLLESLGESPCGSDATHVLIWHHNCVTYPSCVPCYERLLDAFRRAMGQAGWMCMKCREDLGFSPIDQVRLESL